MVLGLRKHGFAAGSLTLALTAASLWAAPNGNSGPILNGTVGESLLFSVVVPSEHADAASTAGTEVELVRERYADGKVRVERQITLDSEDNYVNHGSWKLFSTQGDVIAEGQYNLGQRVGVWTRWLSYADAKTLSELPLKDFKAPFISKANFADGKMDGEWTITDASERKVMTVSLKAGERNGTTTIWLPKGTIYQQQSYDRAVPVGEVLELNPKTGTTVKSASFDNGRKVITKTEYHSHGRQIKSEMMYLAATTVVQTPDDFWHMTLAKFTTDGSDLRHGSTKTWYANGQLEQETFFDHGKRNGMFTYWYENGQVRATGEYRQDKAEGEWVWYHDNGQKSAVGRYEQGALIGDWRWWDDQGKITKHETFTGTESASSPPDDRMDLSRRDGDKPL